jgi:hypothetical protein
MRHVQLFESFSSEADLASMLRNLKSDRRFSNWDMMIEVEDEIPFLIWGNPADSPEWMRSGYAEDYNGNFSSVEPMPILAFTEIFGSIFAYILSPEEKYSKSVVMVGGELNPNQFRMIENANDLKAAINYSLWEME